MMHRKLICIDFGSAYTKIAIRRELNGTASLARDMHLLEDKGAFCIPSVVARVERRGGTKWLFGDQAAAITAGDGTRVYRNWKEKLFSPGRTPVEYREVALAFFGALHGTIKEMGVGEWPARVCIPKLGDDGAQGRVAGLLSEAGWTMADALPTLYEPESNVVGVLTRGRNWTHPQPRTLYPYLRKMLDEAGLLYAVRNGQDYYGVLVVDVGAFTTDFGFVNFNTDFEHQPDIEQASCEIGVRQLDDGVLASLAEEKRTAIRVASFREFEQAKRLLYSGEAARVRKPGGGTLDIGGSRDRQAIDAAIAAFARRVAGAAKAFIDSAVNDTVHACVLTGGGSAIPLVVKEIHAAVRGQIGHLRIYDLLDRATADCLPQKWDAVGRPVKDKAGIAQRYRDNLDLMRGASAIGGCSVLFDVETLPSHVG